MKKGKKAALDLSGNQGMGNMVRQEGVFTHAFRVFIFVKNFEMEVGSGREGVLNHKHTILNNTIVGAIEEGLPDIGLVIGGRRRHRGEELRAAAATRKSSSLS